MPLRNKFIPFILLLLTAIQSHAADRNMATGHRFADSLLPVSIRHIQKEDIAIDLLEAEAEYERKRDDRKGMRRLLRVIKIKRLIPDSRRGYRLFTNLAIFSARLKLYPLAMKFYNRAGEYKRNKLLSWYQSPVFAGPGIAPNANPGAVPDTSLNQIPASPDPGLTDPDGTDTAISGEVPLADSAAWSYLQRMDSLSALAGATEKRSPPVQVRNLRASFDDGKTALSYALILHAKQPIPGKRRAFTHISNVGHMFITLIKYNSDNSVTARSFGFYPHKKNFFSATPLHINSPSVFKDDASHDWDESIGKFISAARFEKILGLLSKYDNAIYNLKRNNCTDFGLDIASLVGIGITDTRGAWPLGKGNNPGSAGQSMLEGKYRNIDGDKDSLFVCNNVPIFP